MGVFELFELLEALVAGEGEAAVVAGGAAVVMVEWVSAPRAFIHEMMRESLVQRVMQCLL